MSTPHNEAKKEDIAKKVLMPGDPLRAKFIAENFLDTFKQVNQVRNMFAFTGTYKGEPVTIMGSGMGIPSIGIYSYELYDQYDVEKIIRIGSGGAYQDYVNLKDVVIGIGACTDSNYASQYNLPGTFAPIGSFNLAKKAVEVANENNINVHVGNIVSSDKFYHADKTAADRWREMGVLCVEMEAAGLYMNAAKLRREALAIISISDHVFKGTELDSKERQVGFTDMMKIALEI